MEDLQSPELAKGLICKHFKPPCRMTLTPTLSLTKITIAKSKSRFPGPVYTVKVLLIKVAVIENDFKVDSLLTTHPCTNRFQFLQFDQQNFDRINRPQSYKHQILANPTSINKT